MTKTKPKITEVMKRNMYVKCPYCGQYNIVLKTTINFACRRCRKPVSMEEKYKVDKYY